MRVKPGTYNSKDSNHHEIVRYLLSEGCLVESITGEKGHGMTDLIVGFNHCWALVEIKSEAGRLRSDQAGFRDRCHAHALPWFLVRSVDDCIACLLVMGEW